MFFPYCLVFVTGIIKIWLYNLKLFLSAPPPLPTPYFSHIVYFSKIYVYFFLHDMFISKLFWWCEYDRPSSRADRPGGTGYEIVLLGGRRSHIPLPPNEQPRFLSFIFCLFLFFVYFHFLFIFIFFLFFLLFEQFLTHLHI